jgi:O-antigen ligase
MIKQNIEKTQAEKNTIFQLTVICLAGLIIGIACIWFSARLTLVGLLVIAAIFIIIKRPEISLIGILIATSSIVFEDQLPLLSFGGISLHISDLLLLGSLGLILVTLLVDPKFRIVRTSLDLPLILFYVFMIVSTLYAVSRSSVDIEAARRAIRPITYYFTFFIVTNLIRNRRQLNFLLNGIYILATIVAIVMVVQYFLGKSTILIPGRVESLSTQNITYEDITRILPPGLSIILVAFLVFLCSLTLEKIKTTYLVKLLQFGIFGMALIFTFLRSYWAVVLVAYFLLIFLIKGKEKLRLIYFGLLAIGCVFIVLILVYCFPTSRLSTFVNASTDRLTTIFMIGTYQGQDNSYQWRRIENEYAIAQIAMHPIIGIGMTARYRPWDPRIDTIDIRNLEYDFRQHIHNGHLKVLLNSGFAGYLCLMWLSFVFMLRGFRKWRKITDPKLQSAVLGFTLAYLAVFISSAVNSSFTQWQWTPVLGIILGVNEVIYKNQDQDSSIA